MKSLSLFYRVTKDTVAAIVALITIAFSAAFVEAQDTAATTTKQENIKKLADGDSSTPSSFQLSILDQSTDYNAVALAINNHDLILGELKVNGSTESLLWRKKESVVGFRKPQTRIGGINDKGVAVGAFILETGSSLFLQDGDKKTALEDFGGMEFRMPMAINNSSMVAGINYRDSGFDSWIWSDGKTTKLPTLGGNTTHVRDINRTGNVVGYSTLANQTSNRAFVFDVSGSMKELTSHHDCDSEAFGINDLGQIVGYSVDQFGGKRGSIWEGESVNRLAALPGDRSSSAMAVNDDGWVVGSSVNQDGTQQAVLWIGDEIYNLREMISGIGTTELMVAKDINPHYSPRT